MSSCAPISAGRELGEDRRVLGQLVAHLQHVVAVVQPDADDLLGRRHQRGVVQPVERVRRARRRAAACAAQSGRSSSARTSASPVSTAGSSSTRTARWPVAVRIVASLIGHHPQGWMRRRSAAVARSRPAVCLRPGGLRPPGTAGRKNQMSGSRWARTLGDPGHHGADQRFRIVLPVPFSHTDVLPLGDDTTTEYRCLDLRPATSSTPRSAARSWRSRRRRSPRSSARPSTTSSTCCGPSHLAQLRAIVDDPEASPNDRFVATDLLRNACVSAGGVLPMCQDTGTAIVVGKRTETVLTGGNDEEAISRGIFEAYEQLNLRYSQMAPTSFWDERNTGYEPARAGRAVQRAGREPALRVPRAWPRAAARPTRPSSTRRRRRC